VVQICKIVYLQQLTARDLDSSFYFCTSAVMHAIESCRPLDKERLCNAVPRRQAPS